MGQPVRKIIQESHPDVNVKPFYTLLIDGNNILFQSFADKKTNSNGEHYGAVFQFLLQLRMMIQKRSFDYVYVFFDDEDSGMLRFQLYNAYKANRDKKYAEHLYLSDYGMAVESKLKAWKEKYASKKSNTSAKDEKDAIVDENFARERDILLNYFNELYIRWIFNDKTEGDDLISYYVNHKKPEEMIYIMSSDEDLTQLIRKNVCIYNQRLKKYYHDGNFKQEKGYPVENVLIKKIFCGDTSDNIGNIKGLSESRLEELMPEFKTRPITVEEVKARAQKLIDERVAENKKPLKWHENIVNGVSNKEYDGDFYEINRKIIDLNHPLLTADAEEELVGMMYTPQDPDGRSFENLYAMVKQDGIDEIKDSTRFATFFAPFKNLADKEIRRYEEIYGNPK